MKNTIKVAVHSFKGGTGKSTITANAALMLAHRGKNVGVVDLDLAGPGLHVLLGVQNTEIKNTLNDLFLGGCLPLDTVLDLSPRLSTDLRMFSEGEVLPGTGPSATMINSNLVFIPASFKPQDMIKVLTRGYEVRLFREAIRQISEAYNLDYLFIDTHPGIEESTLLALGVCDILLLLSRIDSQDLFGTGIVLEVAKALNKPKILAVNMVPPGTDEEKLRARIKHMFSINAQVAVPFYTEILKTLSSEVARRLAPLIAKLIEVSNEVDSDGMKSLLKLNEVP
jgi:MinD-like ATPase involved in chromosome partitioning or flagellar assembly